MHHYAMTNLTAQEQQELASLEQKENDGTITNAEKDRLNQLRSKQ